TMTRRRRPDAGKSPADHLPSGAPTGRTVSVESRWCTRGKVARAPPDDPTCRSYQKKPPGGSLVSVSCRRAIPRAISASCTGGGETGRSVEISSDYRLDLEFEPSTSNSGSSTRWSAITTASSHQDAEPLTFSADFGLLDLSQEQVHRDA